MSAYNKISAPPKLNLSTPAAEQRGSQVLDGQEHHKSVVVISVSLMWEPQPRSETPEKLNSIYYGLFCFLKNMPRKLD